MGGETSSRGSKISSITQLEQKEPLPSKTSLLFAGCSRDPDPDESLLPEFHILDLDFERFDVAPVEVFKTTVSSLNLFVVATYNDLVLCSFSHEYQGRGFGISSPYTKEYMLLPDSPHCSQRYAHVGFICESDRVFKIFRIHEFKGEPAFEFMVEVFSSNTREWTQSAVHCPQGLKYDDIRPDCLNYSGIACNGNLYWICSNGSLLELRLNNSCTSTSGSSNYEYHCRFISAPKSGLEKEGRHWGLGVFQGKLRLSQMAVSLLCWNFVAWDLQEKGGMVEWCMKENVNIHGKVAEQTMPLAFHPNDEDILYLLVRSQPDKPAHIVTFNIRTKKQIQAVQVPPVCLMRTFALVNPTPCSEVPRLWSISMRSGEFRVKRPFGLSAFSATRRGDTSATLLGLDGFRINDLPHNVLVEILIRLPCKSIFQYKCVSKPWLALISQPYFRRHYQALQQKKPLGVKTSFLFAGCTLKSESLPFEVHIVDFEQFHIGPPNLEEFFVVGTHNDLVLFHPAENNTGAMSFGIINPYIKKFVFLPPSPHYSNHNPHVGFTVDSDDVCKVVRIHEFKGKPAFEFMVEVFSSKTGEWRESAAVCPQGIIYSDILPDNRNYTGMVFNGSFYWVCSDGSLLELKLNSTSTSTAGTCEYHCRIMSKPESGFEEDYITKHWRLGVSQGRLRLLQTAYRRSIMCWIVVVWDLEESDGMMKWSLKLKNEVVDPVALERNLLGQITPLAIDPNDENILHLLFRSHPTKHANIGTFNVRTKSQVNAIAVPPMRWMKTFAIVNTASSSDDDEYAGVWPTPVPRIPEMIFVNYAVSEELE